MSFVIPGIAVADVPKYAWKSQIVYDVQDPPVQNTLYELLDEEGGVRLVSISFRNKNDDIQDQEVDVIITIDGEVFTYDGSIVAEAVDNKIYFVWLSSSPNAVDNLDLYNSTDDTTGSGGIQLLGSQSNTKARYEGKPFEGHDIKVEIRVTDAPGTNMVLYSKVVFETLEAV